MKENCLSIFRLLIVTKGRVKSPNTYSSQIHEALLLTSPAHTGFFNGYFRSTANYRNQWSVIGTYVLYRFKDGTKITGEKKEVKVGVGLYYRNDDALIAQLMFDMRNFAVDMAYDYNTSIYLQNSYKESRWIRNFITVQYSCRGAVP